MSHGMDNNVAVLRRWAAHSGGALPSDWQTYARNNMQESIEISRRDPELVALLQGSASATLRADALSGKFSAVPPDWQQRERQEAFDRKQEIIKRLDSGEGTITDHMILESEAPEEYARLKAKHGPTPEQVQQQQRQQAIQQQESLRESKARANAQLRANSQARGIY